MAAFFPVGAAGTGLRPVIDLLFAPFMTLSFMALTYFLIPVLFRKQVAFPGLARWQPYLFGFSMYFFCLVMMGAGTLGVSRRHWDMGFSGAALPHEFPGTAYLMMGLMAVSGVLATVGGEPAILPGDVGWAVLCGVLGGAGLFGLGSSRRFMKQA